MLKCSIGIMAYNEEATIGALLNSLLGQELINCSIEEIIVVASGCSDRTEEIVREFLKKDERIKLLVQEERQGKASAINFFLSRANSEILVLESGDTLPQKDTIGKLVEPLQDSKIGMVGGHPIPANSPENFVGFAVNLLWDLHHKIALEHPKCGEIIAFRNVVDRIDSSSAVDEACLESLIKEAGYELYYAPDAIIRNKGPETIRDFIVQRRRIAAGHRQLKKERGYQVSTASPWRIMRTILMDLSFEYFFWTVGTIFLEAYIRFLGAIDTFRNKNHYVWEVAQSTKEDLEHDKDTLKDTPVSAL